MSETLVSAVGVGFFSRNKLLGLEIFILALVVTSCFVLVPTLFFLMLRFPIFSSSCFLLWFSIFVYLHFVYFVDRLVPLCFCSLSSRTSPPFPTPFLFDVLLVVTQPEFGFVPTFLRQFRPFIQERWVIDLAHDVHLLGETESTISASFCVWVGVF